MALLPKCKKKTLRHFFRKQKKNISSMTIHLTGHSEHQHNQCTQCTIRRSPWAGAMLSGRCGSGTSLESTKLFISAFIRIPFPACSSRGPLYPVGRNNHLGLEMSTFPNADCPPPCWDSGSAQPPHVASCLRPSLSGPPCL